MNNKILIILLSLVISSIYAFGAKKNSTSKIISEHQKNDHDEHKDHGGEKHDDHGEDKHGDHGEEKHDDHDEDKHGDHDEEKHDDHDEEKHDDHGEDKHADHGEDRHDDHENSKFGVGKAIEAFEPSRGFKLSTESIGTLGIKFKEVSNNSFVVDRSSLVISKELKGLYFLRDGFFKLLNVEFRSINDDKYRVTVKEMKDGDKLVTDGVELLRVADVYSADDAEYGHGH